MEIVNKILKHPNFIQYIKMNANAEKERKFCHHNMQHAIDVARVSYIISLEKGYNIKKDIIYSTALLHDIAKWKQYKEGLDHAIEGVILAKEILDDIEVNKEDSQMILEAIRCHRKKGEKISLLSEILYAGDKACRLCIECDAIDDCNRFFDRRAPELKY